MRIILFAFVSLAVACGSVQSLDECCVDEADCAQIKSAVVIPCEAGQVCTASHECVAAECETSMDCTDDAPICRVGFCESICMGDADCADVAGRTSCSPEGACVGCVDSTDCSGDTAFCDADENVCRGCERDNECASGVCIEAEGTCALDADILFVANGSDTGTCTKLQPCLTLSYAISRITAGNPRNVIRIEGGFAANETTTLDVTTRVVIDGTGTRVQKPNAMVPWMAIRGSGQVVLGGLTIEGASTMTNPNITVANASLTLGPDTILKSYVQTTSSTLIVDRSTLDGGTIACNNGTLTVDRARLDDSELDSTNCQFTVQRSRLTKGADRMLGATGGKVTVENSLFVNTYEYSDSIRITSVSPGSTFRFNTVANLSGIDSDGVALSCDATLEVSSNVFAYRSEHPFGYQSPCTAEYSIFDDHTLSSALTTSNTQFVPFTSIFTDPVGRDFTLSASSAAKAAADPAITDVLIDIDGNARPAGSADAGAFEAP
jgi:hypothetical protein